MKKIYLYLVIFTLLFTFLAVKSLADERRVCDNDGLLTAEEKVAVESALSEAEERTGFKFRVYAVDSQVYSGESDLVFDEFGLYDTDCVFLFVDRGFDGRFEYELFTYGEAYGDLSDSSVNLILDHQSVYGNIKSGRLYEGLLAFADLTAEEILFARQSALITVIAVAVVLGIIAGGSATGIIIYKYKKKLKSPVYPLSKYANMTLDYSTDNFLGSSITRTRVSSSGSRTGGGGGGGGGSRGKR